MRKILATKSGWLIGVDVINETSDAHVVKEWCEKTEHTVLKNSTTEKLFDCTDDAEKWITS